MGWNSALHPEFDAAEVFVPSDKVADRYRSAGSVLVAHRRDGIAGRGVGRPVRCP